MTIVRSDGTTATPKAVLRAAGVAGVVGAAIHLSSFGINQVLHLLNAQPLPEYPTPAQMAEELPLAAVRAIVFTAVTVLTVVALSGLAAHLLRRGSASAVALPPFVAMVGVGLLGSGLAAVVQSAFVNDYISGSGASAGAQSAVVQGLFVVPQAFATLAGIALAGFLAVVSIAGRRILPRWLLALGSAFAVVSVGMLFTGVPAGVVLLPPYLLAAGTWALRASRSAS
ncbi:hypothetical protein [Isoptericola sp. NPDC058082]|uniref:hypothetical protein n=1 Tax=Isoptericola sp. NPDC058082 TaxID=3346331 RepID=UPI0036E79B9C